MDSYRAYGRYWDLTTYNNLTVRMKSTSAPFLSPMGHSRIQHYELQPDDCVSKGDLLYVDYFGIKNVECGCCGSFFLTDDRYEKQNNHGFSFIECFSCGSILYINDFQLMDKDDSKLFFSSDRPTKKRKIEGEKKLVSEKVKNLASLSYNCYFHVKNTFYVHNKAMDGFYEKIKILLRLSDPWIDIFVRSENHISVAIYLVIFTRIENAEILEKDNNNAIVSRGIENTFIRLTHQIKKKRLEDK